jgi:hypothetical protein
VRGKSFSYQEVRARIEALSPERSVIAPFLFPALMRYDAEEHLPPQTG